MRAIRVLNYYVVWRFVFFNSSTTENVNLLLISINQPQCFERHVMKPRNHKNAPRVLRVIIYIIHILKNVVTDSGIAFLCNVMLR